MQESNLARRYALGLVKAVKDENEYIQIKENLTLFQHLLDRDENLRTGFETLIFSKTQKHDLLKIIQSKLSLNRKAGNFITTLLDEGRLTLLRQILLQYEDIWLETNGFERLTVFSVIPLSETLETELREQLEKAFGKKILLKKKIDPTLIAGIKIQQGAIFYDFSIAGNLKKLKQELVEET